jgi:hypothetical protein
MNKHQQIVLFAREHSSSSSTGALGTVLIEPDHSTRVLRYIVLGLSILGLSILGLSVLGLRFLGLHGSENTVNLHSVAKDSAQF